MGSRRTRAQPLGTIVDDIAAARREPQRHHEQVDDIEMLAAARNGRKALDLVCSDQRP
jgi:hypothetical protein